MILLQLSKAQCAPHPEDSDLRLPQNAIRHWLPYGNFSEVFFPDKSLGSRPSPLAPATYCGGDNPPPHVVRHPTHIAGKKANELPGLILLGENRFPIGPDSLDLGLSQNFFGCNLEIVNESKRVVERFAVNELRCPSHGKPPPPTKLGKGIHFIERQSRIHEQTLALRVQILFVAEESENARGISGDEISRADPSVQTIPPALGSGIDISEAILPRSELRKNQGIAVECPE